jgi:hypothetical protein
VPVNWEKIAENVGHAAEDLEEARKLLQASETPANDLEEIRKLLQASGADPAKVLEEIRKLLLASGIDAGDEEVTLLAEETIDLYLRARMAEARFKLKAQGGE